MKKNDLKKLLIQLGNGYDLIYTWSGTRYLYAIVEKKGTKYFFKLARKTETNINIDNEIVWNTEINKKLAKSDIPICHPNIIEIGEIENRKFVILEYYPPNKGLYNENLSSEFENYIDTIINYMFWVQELKIKFPVDKLYKDKLKENITNIIIQQTKLYIKDIGTLDNYYKLRNIIANSKINELKTAHREIKPQHLFILNNKLGLIDSEWATSFMPKHYDIAASYARVFTQCRSPEVANKLLDAYMIKVDDLGTFKSNFTALLAWRSIGEYRDAVINSELYDEHKLLINKIVTNQIFEN